MFSFKKNKVHSTFDPSSKSIQEPDHQQLSKVLQHVTGQLNLMLELQQQQQQQQQKQQQASNFYSLTDSCNAGTMDEYEQYEYRHRHHQRRETCCGNASQYNFRGNNTRRHNCYQQCPMSPSASSYFTTTHQPQYQCMSTCPHDIYQQKNNPCHFQHLSFQQSQCSNSAIPRHQQVCHHYPLHKCHHCTSVSNTPGPCSGTHPDLSSTMTSPQSVTMPESIRNLNVFGATASFEQIAHCKNKSSYSTCPTTTSTSTRAKFNKRDTDPALPPFPDFGRNDAARTNGHSGYYDDDNGNQHNIYQRPHSPRFPNLSNDTPPPPPPRRTENLQQRRNHQFSWTDIYRQDLLSRQDALISPTVSSYDNAVYTNKVKRSKLGHSQLRTWWTHGKYRWDQLRRKKFTKCFI